MDFTLLLFVLVLATGVAWLAEILYFSPQRERQAKKISQEFDEQVETRSQLRTAEKPSTDNITNRIDTSDNMLHAIEMMKQNTLERTLKRPVWLEYTAGFFPVILLVFVLRSFLFEPFKIPSTSMVPTLQVGDFILVNKFNYGIRLPVVDLKIMDIGQPKRGDVMVFRYPKDPKTNYIKRVIGLPGDKIVYENKRLTINGQAVASKRLEDYFDASKIEYVEQYAEKLGNNPHLIINNPGPPADINRDNNINFPFRENCRYYSGGITCYVPAGHYFVMGDNRDGSADSRYWGFVPDRNIVGRAFFVWMNLSDLKRIGQIK